jgi:LPXTG-motif cell wall-anchored protein
MTLRLTTALIALLLALPAAALAQGAGDEQYSDPFGPDQQQQSEPTPQPTAAPTQAPATAAPSSQTAPAPAPTAAPAAPAASSAPQLPYTGVDAGWVALGGAVLLGAGLALRRRTGEEQ